MTRHKHYEFIIAWANGAEIERYDNGLWVKIELPMWLNSAVYRIKYKPKPDVVLYSYTSKLNCDYANLANARILDYFNKNIENEPNIKLTYDGETKELKSVEKI